MSSRKNRSTNQLTDPMKYNVDDIIFDDPIASEVGKVKTYRIPIATKYADGSEGDLILGLDKCMSYGVQENRDEKTDALNGYSISISLKDRDSPSDRQIQTIDVLDTIVEKCKDHLLQMHIKKSIGKITLDRSELKKISPVWRKINQETGEVDESAIPAIYPKLIYAKEKQDPKTKQMVPARVLTKFYLADEVDENGDPQQVNPVDFIGKRSTVSCALKIEGIFVGQVIKLQCKVVEVDIKPQETKQKRLLTSGWSSHSSSSSQQSTTVDESEIRDEDDDETPQTTVASEPAKAIVVSEDEEEVPPVVEQKTTKRGGPKKKA
jgi:hypothetical protein